METFAQSLQFCISPIVLISAGSLLLLSITNRLGRAIDRARLLSRELNAGSTPSYADPVEQLHILIKRSQYLRSAVLGVSASILLAGAMILAVFGQAFLGWDLKGFILGFVLLSVLALCVGVLYLIRDVLSGLEALRIDVSPHLAPRKFSPGGGL